MITEYQAKYFAHELSKRCQSDSAEKFGATLLDAKVDLNPHQIEAALFAFKSPLSKGAILADEVGLGKTIEAGILLSQKWAEGKKRILIICPSSLRKQWVQELADKFYLPASVIETKSFNESLRGGSTNPFEQKNKIQVCSYHFTKNKSEWVQLTNWDLVIIDEAHYLRNSYKPSNKIGSTLRNALEGKRKILLTATPLQNSILELYGLVSFIDDNIFGDVKSFRSQFLRFGRVEFEDLKDRIASVCNRTLRRQVQEYINYTNRIPITEQFVPSKEEEELYQLVTNYLQRERLYALPSRQRHLMTLILRKLLASSSFAISGTLENLVKRLKSILVRNKLLVFSTVDVDDTLVFEEEFDDIWDDLDDEMSDVDYTNIEHNGNDQLTEEQIEGINKEIEELETFLELSNSIIHNAKGDKLRVAIDKGFEKLNDLGANQKAIIFTESRRTQSYLFDLLEDKGFKGRVALFNGTNTDAKSKLIYKSWLEKNKYSDKITGSKPVDIRAAIVDHFKSDLCDILIATEAAAEGINLQFCSMIVNYDLPWNPQRIEQRIGRCHRYGQKHDVVVVNFINTNNAADQRVFALLNEKFQLFDGVFGASDDILGAINSGVDFEKRIAEIYQNCRTQKEIEKSFDELQSQLEDEIENKMKSTQKKLFEHFDADVIDKLKIRLDETKVYVSKYQHWLWQLTLLGLKEEADFDKSSFSFTIRRPIRLNLTGGGSIPTGVYTLDKKRNDAYHYRVGHPIAQNLIDRYKNINLPVAELTFNYSSLNKSSVALEQLEGCSGILNLSNIVVSSFEKTDNLVFSGLTDSNILLDNDLCQRLFDLPVFVEGDAELSKEESSILQLEKAKNKEALITQLKEKDTHFFKMEVDKLHKWAEDNIIASEKELRDVKAKIKDLNRASKKTSSPEELLDLQTQLQILERKKKRLRREIFDIEDEIEEKRDQMIETIRSKMMGKIEEREVLTIRFKVI